MINRCEYKLTFVADELLSKEVLALVENEVKRIITAGKINGSKVDIKILQAKSI